MHVNELSGEFKTGTQKTGVMSEWQHHGGDLNGVGLLD